MAREGVVSRMIGAEDGTLGRRGVGESFSRVDRKHECVISLYFRAYVNTDPFWRAGRVRRSAKHSNNFQVARIAGSTESLFVAE